MQPDRVLRVPGKVGHDAHAAHGERESRAACGAWASAASARWRAAREVVTDRDKPELETHDMTQVLATLTPPPCSVSVVHDAQTGAEILKQRRRQSLGHDIC